MNATTTDNQGPCLAIAPEIPLGALAVGVLALLLGAQVIKELMKDEEEEALS